MKLGKILKKPRVMVLLFFLLMSFLAINPQFSTSGVAIKSIEQNSSAEFAGIIPPDPDDPSTALERIIKINDQEISTLEEYSAIIEQISLNEKITITTNENTYFLLKTDNLGIEVQTASTSNIRKGLDLQGGTRVIVKPTEKVTEQDIDDLIKVMEFRLNTYGLQDIDLRKANDLLGNNYIIIEMAGATKQEVAELIGSQGVFEAKIKEEVIFTGGKEDISSVCRNDGTCAGIRDCSEVSDGYTCRFEFRITLTQKAAKSFAGITEDIPVNFSTTGEEYLSEKLDFYLDGESVDSLNIAADLKGVEATNILISGPGFGETENEAIQTAQKQMEKLQTLLVTGSFPFQLEIVKSDAISPVLGQEFLRNAIIAGLFAVLAVALVVFIRYRKFKIVIPMIITALSEIFIILGFAALFRYNLDLAAIAGIIAAVGTGVDDQIVIVDEALTGESEQIYQWKEKIKRAFFIIMAAYATTFVAMLPLWFAGAGLIRGFAITIVVGITIGVFLTRPAFAAMIEELVKE